MFNAKSIFISLCAVLAVFFFVATADAGKGGGGCKDRDSDGYFQKAGCGTAVDCIDDDSAINPGAAEVCDGIDNNCDGTVDEGCGGCIDNDGDGYGSGPDCLGPDCDDSNAAVNPGAAEVCDGVDNNCDGTVDEGCGGCTDNDGDGYGSGPDCLGPDCDDNDAAVNPGASEVCDDGIDNNCDGTIDEGCSGCVPTASKERDCDCFDNADNDCDGSIDSLDRDCKRQTCDTCFDDDGDGWFTCGNDCDDSNPAINPGAPEVCNGIDDNCDDLLPIEEQDVDWDGVSICEGDCDDNNPSRYPGNTEEPFGSPVCNDGIDNDCDFLIDAGDPGCDNPCIDNDGDGFGVNGDPFCPNPFMIDCDDSDSSINPGVHEGPYGDPVCSDGRDNDCDTSVDMNDYGCQQVIGYDYYPVQIAPNTWRFSINVRVKPAGVLTFVNSQYNFASQTNGIDVDYDYNGIGIDYSKSGLFLGTAPTLYTGGQPLHGWDVIDLDDGVFSGIVYATATLDSVRIQVDSDSYAPLCSGVDIDNDTYYTGSDCGNLTDCNDNSPGVSPGADEDCTNNIDDNCNGLIDANDPLCSSLCVEDSDNDGFGNPASPACAFPALDCNDSNPNINPNITEICDGLDNDCDGAIDEGFDIDADGFTTCTGDCDDADPNINPGELEGPVGDPTCTDVVDNDCDGFIDAGDADCSDGADFPHDIISDCTVCHDPGTYVLNAPIPNSKCEQCHTPAGILKGSYLTAPDVMTHFSSQYIDPTTGVLVNIDCVECHNPMRPQTNLAHIRSVIRGWPVVFTAFAGPGSFADGFPPYDGICEVCHTQTNHHQVDGTAPGGQDHMNGEDCRTCHAHIDGFNVNCYGCGGSADVPHDIITDCNYCHVGGDYTIPIPDSKCNDCHTPGGVLKGSYPTAQDVATHQNRDCVECHDPMYAQTNLSHVRSMIAGSVIPGSTIVFIAKTGAGSFADGPPYEENICNTCHTLTNHHQADGTAPGGQNHNDGTDCTACHTHEDGFSPGIIDCFGPHDTVIDCNYCHVTAVFSDPIPDSACNQCHTASGSLKGSFPTAPDVETHQGNSYSFIIDCVECHTDHCNSNNLALIRSTIAGSIYPGSQIVFTALSGPGSFADGPPYEENICDTCHSMTNHHQADGTAPGGQVHNDSLDCTGCHTHNPGVFFPTF